MIPVVEAVRRWLLPALLALLLCAPWLPGLWRGAERHALEIVVESSLPGVAELRSDVGHGFSEQRSSRGVVQGTSGPETLRLVIPDGAVRALGLGLLAAMGLRLAWQAWRERRARRSLAASEHAVPAATA
ncbi:MAG: hypothetical protein ACK5CF_14545, partial [Opitutaceae bacterium]